MDKLRMPRHNPIPIPGITVGRAGKYAAVRGMMGNGLGANNEAGGMARSASAVPAAAVVPMAATTF
jgi:hypothetical protein